MIHSASITARTTHREPQARPVEACPESEAQSPPLPSALCWGRSVPSLSGSGWAFSPGVTRRLGISKSKLIRRGVAAVLPAIKPEPATIMWLQQAGFGSKRIGVNPGEIDEVVCSP